MKAKQKKNIVRVSVLIKHLLSFQSFWRSQAYFLALQTGEKFRQQSHWVLATTYLFFFLFLSFFRLFFFCRHLENQGWFSPRMVLCACFDSRILLCKWSYHRHRQWWYWWWWCWWWYTLWIVLIILSDIVMISMILLCKTEHDNIYT